MRRAARGDVRAPHDGAAGDGLGLPREWGRRRRRRSEPNEHDAFPERDDAAPDAVAHAPSAAPDDGGRRAACRNSEKQVRLPSIFSTW